MTTDLDPEDEDDEDDSEDALGEFDFLGSGEEGEGAGEARISGDGRELGMEAHLFKMFQTTRHSCIVFLTVDVRVSLYRHTVTAHCFLFICFCL